MKDDFEQIDETSMKKPKVGGFKDTSKRLRQGKEKHLSHRASLDWRQDAARVCEKTSVVAADFPEINTLKEILLKSSTGAALLSGEEAPAPEICYDTQIMHAQFYPQGNGIITLNPYRPTGDLINTLSRGLRHAWQYRREALVNPMSFSPEEAVLVNRAQQADAFMISVRVAWELKLLGEQEAWNFIAGSPMGDVTRTFEIHAQKDFRTLNNGEASRAAYDKFFEDSRTKIHDKRIIHQMLLDDSKYMKSSQENKRADMDLFRKIGELPQGRNYLAACGSRLPTDLCYSTIEDRSNANFLWFIKFERSFQEKEREMIKESVKISGEIVDFAKWSSGARRPDNRRN